MRTGARCRCGRHTGCFHSTPRGPLRAANAAWQRSARRNQPLHHLRAARFPTAPQPGAAAPRTASCTRPTRAAQDLPHRLRRPAQRAHMLHMPRAQRRFPHRQIQGNSPRNRGQDLLLPSGSWARATSCLETPRLPRSFSRYLRNVRSWVLSPVVGILPRASRSLQLCLYEIRFPRFCKQKSRASGKQPPDARHERKDCYAA